MDTVEDTLEAASYLQVTEALGLAAATSGSASWPRRTAAFAANVAARLGLAHMLGAAERCIVTHLRELLEGARPGRPSELNPASLSGRGLGAP